MKINWHSQSSLGVIDMSERIKLEYSFRKIMTKFLIINTTFDYCSNFECYVFDYFAEEKRVELSAQTPEPYYSQLKNEWSHFESIAINRIAN